MTPIKGGRGKKLPWESTHVRCPEPIAEEIRQKIEQWKVEQLGGSPTVGEPSISNEAVQEIAEKVLRSRKSAKVSVQQVLTELGYHIDL